MFRYQKDGDYGNTELFQTVTVGNGPQFDINIGNGIISKVEFSTDSEYDSNWELRFVDIQVNDSFDYAAVDSEGALSEDATVSVASTSSDSTTEQLNIELNEADLSPDSTEQAKAQFSDENTTFIQNSTPETSGLVANASITWQLVGDLWTGSIEGENVITLSLNNGEITANLLGAIPHINEPDAENQPVTVTVQTSSGSALISIVDDIPEIQADSPTYATPDPELLKLSDGNSGITMKSYLYKDSVKTEIADGIKEWGQGFGVVSGQGGDKSTGSNKNEIQYLSSNGNGTYESIEATLPDGSVGFSLTLTLGKVQDGGKDKDLEDIAFTVVFYKNGQQVDTKTFKEDDLDTSDAPGQSEKFGSLTINIPEGFDQIEIIASNNGDDDENSDFTLVDLSVNAVAEGLVNADFGADGEQSIELALDTNSLPSLQTAGSPPEDIFIAIVNGKIVGAIGVTQVARSMPQLS